MFNSPVHLPSSHIMRPEKRPDDDSVFEEFLETAWRSIIAPVKRLGVNQAAFVQQVITSQKAYHGLDDGTFKDKVLSLRHALKGRDYDINSVATAFALVREATRRTLGIEHYESQLKGGFAMFCGCVAEMQTGEGKTLTALLPACAAAFKGVQVDIVTVNDYLAGRDANEMSIVYEFLGLSVGCVTNGLSPAERRNEYSRNIVYCTNKELVFDYLKDKINLENRNHHLQLHAARLCGDFNVADRFVLRGLHYAIIDEADSVLMDEARTPLIISGELEINTDQEDMYRKAMDIARLLDEGHDFRLIKHERDITLTDAGKETVLSITRELGGYWKSRIRSYELVIQALYAIYLFERDKHYLVIEGKVEIVDEHTGRVMENRSWERGLHQLIEIKEDCELTKPRSTLAKISYQGFFRKYHHLCGMTGTAMEVAGEFRSVYGLDVVKIPPNRTCVRNHKGIHIAASDNIKWLLIRDRVRNLHREGIPVLVGTKSVAASETLSNLLLESGLEHNLLNAKQDNNEAEIITSAGLTGQITIATNMAGRGTDIKLEDRVRQAGGLYVILTELHDAGRIDRQLEGRCARQGDPGQFEIIISLEDHLVGLYTKRLIRGITGQSNPGFILTRVTYMLMLLNQKLTERKHRSIRRRLLKIDRKQNEILSFSGRHT